MTVDHSVHGLWSFELRCRIVNRAKWMSARFVSAWTCERCYRSSL